MATINAPLRFDEITAAQGISQDVHDLGHFAQGASNAETPPGTHTNKWAFNKPVRLNQHTSPTDADMISVHCGLAPVTLPKMLRMSYGLSGYSDTEAQCIAQVAEWSYLQPRGGVYNGSTVNEFFRPLDFNGYRNDAKPTDSLWAAINFDASTLTTLKNATVTISSGTASGDYVLAPSTTKYYQRFGMAFGRSSNQRINVGLDVQIPLTYVMGVTDGNYRLALAVWCPYGPAGSEIWSWQYFISRYTIAAFLATSNPPASMVMPDFATNTLAATGMYNYMNSQNGYVEFDAVPVFVKNMWYNTGNNLYYPYFVSSVDAKAVYCMPSGQGAFKIGCGEPPTVNYSQVIYDTSESPTAIKIKNTDTATHTFKYIIQTQSTTNTGVVNNMAGGEIRRVGTVVSGVTTTCTVIEQDEQPV